MSCWQCIWCFLIHTAVLPFKLYRADSASDVSWYTQQYCLSNCIVLCWQRIWCFLIHTAVLPFKHILKKKKILNLVRFKTSNKILKTETKQLWTIIFHISNHITISPLEAIWSGEWTNPYQYNDLHRIATIFMYGIYTNTCTWLYSYSTILQARFLVHFSINYL
jgi:hypothetical protein